MTNSKAIFMTASALALMTASGAWAQNAAPSATVEEVVITGSRLNNVNFAAPTPVKVMGAEQIQQRAPATMGEITNELPGFRNTGPGVGSRSSGATVGQNNPDLRGLGSRRTLVLVDGRRHVPTSQGSSVDTNFIPASLVQRVEVVTGGASAAYGSDAVAGVVNFILNDRLTGLSGSLQHGQSKYGDNKEWSGNLAYGTSFADDRGHFIIGGDYSKNTGVGDFYNREWGRREPGQVTFPSPRAPGVPANGYLDNVELSTVTPGSIILSGPLKGTAFDSGGNPYPFQYGTVLSSNMVGSTANYGSDLFARFQIKTPLERYAALARLNYEVNDNLTLYLEGGYGRLNNYGGMATTTQLNNYIVSRDNPFLPAATRNAMIANNLTTVQIGRYNTDIGRWLTDSDTTTKRLVAGAKGKVFGDWEWEAYYQTGKTRENYNLYNMTHIPNLAAAAWVVTGPDGRPACGAIATNPNLTAANRPKVTANCVPFNIFGAGRASPEAFAYVAGHEYSNTDIKQDVVSFSIAGEPFMLPAGAVSMATGAEWRKDSIVSAGDPLSDLNAPWSFPNPQSYSGKNTVKEGFVEVGVPLLKGLPLVDSLDLNGAVRRTDYRNSGPVTTWKVGFTYDPTPDFRLRFTQSRDIRAPTITELFSKGTFSIGSTGGRNPFNGQSGALPNRNGGGNPNLVPEEADTMTAGLVLTPTWSWAQGFRASVDYYKIVIRGAVGSVSAQDIIERCFQGQQTYCASVTFDNSALGVAEVRVSTFNLNKVATDGVDIDVSYRVPLDRLPGDLPGRLDLRALHTWTDDLVTTVLGTQTDLAGAVAGGLPSISGNYTATYSLGRFLGSVQARYMNEMKYDATFVGPNDPKYDPTSPNSINKASWPAMVYWNLQAQYDIVNEGSRKVQIFGVVNNALDKDPPAFAPVAFNTTAAFNPYDWVGRSWKLGVRFNY